MYGSSLSLSRVHKHYTCRYPRPELVSLDHVEHRSCRADFVANDLSTCKTPYATPSYDASRKPGYNQYGSPRFARPVRCLLLLSIRIYFFFDLATPCFTATDLSAIVRPAEECPFGNCLLASFSSFCVGGFIVSFLVTIFAPRWLAVRISNLTSNSTSSL